MPDTAFALTGGWKGRGQAKAGLVEAAPGFAEAAPGFAEAAQGFAEAAPGFAEAAPGFAEAVPGFAEAAPGFAEAGQCFAKASQGRLLLGVIVLADLLSACLAAAECAAVPVAGACCGNLLCDLTLTAALLADA